RRTVDVEEAVATGHVRGKVQHLSVGANRWVLGRVIAAEAKGLNVPPAVAQERRTVKVHRTQLVVGHRVALVLALEEALPGKVERPPVGAERPELLVVPRVELPAKGLRLAVAAL